MIFKVNPKIKVINKINRLIKFLYNFTIRQSIKSDLTNEEKFAIIQFDNKVRKATEVLIEEFKKVEKSNCVQTGKPCGFPCFDGCPEH